MGSANIKTFATSGARPSYNRIKLVEIFGPAHKKTPACAGGLQWARLGVMQLIRVNGKNSGRVLLGCYSDR